MGWLREQKYNICDLVETIWKREWSELSYSWYKFYDGLIHPIYNLFRQTRVIFSYLPILWKDRDWDSAFLLYLMRHKLSRMEKSFRNGNHVGCEKQANKMRQCIDIIDRIEKDAYAEEEYTAHMAKWGEGKHSFIPCPDRPDLCTWETSYPNVKTPEDDTQRSNEFRAIMDEEDHLRNRDYKLLFYIIRRNIRKWWD